MKRFSFLLLSGLMAAFDSGMAASGQLDTVRKCAVPNGKVLSAVYTDASEFTDANRNTITGIPPRTIVKLLLQPAKGSNINVEVWLPDAGRWNGRFVGLGNGGAAGSINPAGFIGWIKRGYAVAATDMGTAPNDNSGVGNPEVWKDFGYRATHLMTTAARQLIQSCYGKPPAFSYFVGASTGGQQALQEAQRYPDDYDGIVANVPAHCRTPLHAYFLWNWQLVRRHPLTPEQDRSIMRSGIEYMAQREIPQLAGKAVSDPRVTPEEIEGIKRSAAINIGVLDLVAERIGAGVTTEEIDKWIYDCTVEHGGIPADLDYEGYPKSVCTSINEVVCHGIPSPDDVLKDGDIVNVDCSTILDGYYSDSSRMFCIGEVSDEKRRLVEETKKALEAGLAAVKPWGLLGDVGAAVHEYAHAQGFSVVEPQKKALAFVGDSTFFASGLPGIVNAVYNGHDFTLCVLDNATTAMTGSQPHPGTGVTLMGERRKPVSIEAVLKAVGFECIVHADPLNLQQSIDAAREAIDFEGPSAIMFESPCVQLFKPAAPVVLDAQRCTGCKKCITEIGCPGIGFDIDARGPKSGERGQAFIDAGQCNGCGLCTQVCPFDCISVVDAASAVSQKKEA